MKIVRPAFRTGAVLAVFAASCAAGLATHAGSTPAAAAGSEIDLTAGARNPAAYVSGAEVVGSRAIFYSDRDIPNRPAVYSVPIDGSTVPIRIAPLDPTTSEADQWWPGSGHIVSLERDTASGIETLAWASLDGTGRSVLVASRYINVAVSTTTVAFVAASTAAFPHPVAGMVDLATGRVQALSSNLAQDADAPLHAFDGGIATADAANGLVIGRIGAPNRIINVPASWTYDAVVSVDAGVAAMLATDTVHHQLRIVDIATGNVRAAVDLGTATSARIDHIDNVNSAVVGVITSSAGTRRFTVPLSGGLPMLSSLGADPASKPLGGPLGADVQREFPINRLIVDAPDGTHSRAVDGSDDVLLLPLHLHAQDWDITASGQRLVSIADGRLASVPLGGGPVLDMGPLTNDEVGSLQFGPGRDDVNFFDNSSTDGTSVVVNVVTGVRSRQNLADNGQGSQTIAFVGECRVLRWSRQMPVGDRLTVTDSDSCPAANFGNENAFVPIAPTRLLDTRGTPDRFTFSFGGDSGDCFTPCVTDNNSVITATQRGGTTSVDVRGVAGVPDSADVTAVVVNVTAVDPDAAGYVTAWPHGLDRPLASNLDVDRRGGVRSALTTVAVGDGGLIDLYTSSRMDLVVDITGYYTKSIGSAAGRFTAVGPVRTFDSRATATTPVPAGTVVKAPVTGVGGIPSTGVGAVVATLTVDHAASTGYVTAWQTGTPRPWVSNVNTPGAGGVVANQITVPVGADGTISLYTLNGADLIVDVVGWFSTDTAAVSTSGLFIPVRPTRLFDTRTTNNRLAAGGATDVAAPMMLFRPAAIVGVLTTVAAGPGFTTMWPSGSAQPTASVLNANAANDIIAVQTTTPTPSGKASIFSQNGGDYLFDLTGFYTS